VEERLHLLLAGSFCWNACTAPLSDFISLLLLLLLLYDNRVFSQLTPEFTI